MTLHTFDLMLRPDEVRRLLSEYRAEKHLSLRDMAKKIGGMTGETVGNIERGAHWPRRTTLLRIEAFLRREGWLKKEGAA